MDVTYPRSRLVTQLLIRRVAEFDVPHSLEACEQLIRAHYPKPRPFSLFILVANNWFIRCRPLQREGETLKFVFSSHMNRTPGVGFEVIITPEDENSSHVLFISISTLFGIYIVHSILVLILCLSWILVDRISSSSLIFLAIVSLLNVAIGYVMVTGQQSYRFDEFRRVLK